MAVLSRLGQHIAIVSHQNLMSSKPPGNHNVKEADSTRNGIPRLHEEVEKNRLNFLYCSVYSTS